MKGLKFAVAALTVAAALMLASNCYAQNIAPLFNGAGSSAAFNAMALAARISNGTSGVCGNHNWTKKSGTATGVDGRSPSINAAGGSVWIVWDDTPEPNRTVCAYLNIDSVVGTRLFFATPRGVLSLPSSAIGAAGDNIVPLVPADEALPMNIYNDLNNQPFNAAPSDIRPEDALFATTRALAALTSTRTGLGYGPGPVGLEILSAFSTKQAQVVGFAMKGTDPITGQTVPKFTTTNVGAQVVMVLVNTADTSSGGFGTSAYTNANRFVLAGFLNGTLGRTRDLSDTAGLPAIGATVLLREPLSGTMNTMEFSIPRSVEINSSQEIGVDPSMSGGNPLNLAGPGSSVRKRVIGTGEMITEIGAVTDSLGYAFFSFGNVKPILTTGKYLQVDGVDPINATYTTGALPSCTAPCPGVVTFPHVVDGSYPIWNVLRVTTGTPAPPGVLSLIAAAKTQVANIPDFISVDSLNVFRSHYTQSGFVGANGHKARTSEAGGDVGGAVYTVQADLDTITDTGKEITGKKQ
jgi:hypothetical protein